MHSLFNLFLFVLYLVRLVNYITNLVLWILKAAAELAWDWLRDFVTIWVQTTSVLAHSEHRFPAPSSKLCQI